MTPAVREMLDQHCKMSPRAIAEQAAALEAEVARLRGAAVRAVKQAAYYARHACLVPPDGGAPTPEEAALCDEASRRILMMLEPGHSTSVVDETACPVLAAVAAEAAQAEAKWPAFNSAHEGFAVLLEEVDELKAHVWTNQKRRDLPEMRAEAIQVAAVAVRFARDVCGEERGRK